jgi:tetratricopeptide (TPR) repeat protein
MKRSPSFCHLLLIVPLFCATFIGCTASEDAALAEQLGRARAALKAKRYHEVLTLLHDTHRNAESPLGKEYGKEYDLMEGLASVKLGDYRRAVDALEKAQPLSLELRIDLAYLHLLLGDAQRARSIAAALELHHGQAPALAILQGNISLKEQAYHEAERHFRRAAVLDRSSAKAHIGLANTYLLQRYFIKAEENYLKAVSLSKTDASAYIALAHYHIVTGRYEDGIYTSEIALRKYPDNINILLARSNLFMHIGKISEGVDILKKSLKMFPHSIDLKINIIRGYYNIGRLDDAYHLIQDLLTDDHENYHGLILMGEYFLRKKDIDLAFFYVIKLPS